MLHVDIDRLLPKARQKAAPSNYELWPEHVRAWTSPAAVETEKDLEGRFAVRGATTHQTLDLEKVADTADTLGVRLDAGQAGAVAELALAPPPRTTSVRC